MLKEITDLVKHLLVYPENMERNMNVYGGVIFSQQVLLALVEKGLNRQEAYKIVQGCAHQAWNTENGNFQALINQNPEVNELLSKTEIDACFNPQHHLKNLEQIYQRLSI
jgi:adenylosuccinate lyase